VADSTISTAADFDADVQAEAGAAAYKDADSGREIPDENLEATDEEILETALARFALAEEAESDMRKAAQEDLEFLSGKQWPLEIQQERDIDRRPCLTVNRLPQQVQQVTNDQRQNRPAIKVSPVDDEATDEIAELIQGIIRHIEYNSNAESAYDTGGESAARGGFGYWRLLTDFVDPESLDQEIFIKRIRNPFSVFLDPYAQEPDGSDANWGFIVEDLSPEEYKARYPGTKLAQASDWSAIGNNVPTWVKSDSCRVAEYLYKELTPSRIHLLATGETVLDKDLEARQASAKAAGIDASVVRYRDTKIPVVKWCTITGIEIIERTIWVGSFIPIIPCYGNELYVNGKKIVESVIRHAKDPQRMLNYWKSAATEAIALAPRAPFIGAEGQFEGHESEWESANRKNHAYLEYKPTSLNGQPAPPPERQAVEPAVQAITQAAAGAADDIKATTGVFDAALGAQSNEVSGVAIQNRASQTQLSNFHFFDNMKRSIRHTGRCLVEIIPKVYDSARAARIVKEDGTQKVVKLNQTYKDEDTGKEVLYDLSVGRYDVVVDTGPSYATRRQEAAASMLDFSKAVPQVAQACSDLIAKNMDWPGAQEIADRLRKLLPPQLQDDPKNKQIPPIVQAQMAQAQMLIKKLTDELNETTKVIETKKLDLEHRERVEMAKIQADIEINLAKLGSQSSIKLLESQVKELMQREKLLGIGQPIGAPQDFNPEGADGGNYAGVGHIGSGPTGGSSPGQTPGENP